jgi:uncharacterized protein
LIAVDTNILVYAHRGESPFHKSAFEAVKSLAEARQPWSLPWSCAHEFIAVVTNGKFISNPSSIEEAFAQIEAWKESGHLVFLGEGWHHLKTLSELAVPNKLRAGQIHDARIAAICLQHGVSELWTADRDFSRFPKLKTRNPLVG